MRLFLKWLASAFAIILSAYLLPGVAVENFWAALWLSLFLGVVNILIRPLLLILTLPINILTLGSFTFVINAGLILLAESVVKGFFLASFWSALLFGIVLSVVTYVLYRLSGIK